MARVCVCVCRWVCGTGRAHTHRQVAVRGHSHLIFVDLGRCPCFVIIIMPVGSQWLWRASMGVRG